MSALPVATLVQSKNSSNFTPTIRRLCSCLVRGLRVLLYCIDGTISLNLNLLAPSFSIPLWVTLFCSCPRKYTLVILLLVNLAQYICLTIVSIASISRYARPS